MTVKEQIKKVRLRVNLDDGLDSKGNQQIDRFSYNRVKSTATPEALYETGATLAGLCEKPLYTIQKDEEIVLVPQA